MKKLIAFLILIPTLAFADVLIYFVASPAVVANRLPVGGGIEMTDLLLILMFPNNHDPEFVGCGTRGMVPYEDKHAACS